MLTQDSLEDMLDFYQSQPENSDPDTELEGSHMATLSHLRATLQQLSSQKNRILATIERKREHIDSLIPAPKVKYHLRGVIIHKGSADLGHYYSFIDVDGEWFRFDDLISEPVDEDMVMQTSLGLAGSPSENSYFLVYAQSDDLGCNQRERSI